MEEKKEYKFDAFISYRHCELDKFVAENLHKILESYELPKNIKKKLNIKSKTIKRVFRDQEELPLSSNLEDPIIDALENSKYLIIICSPRLKDSLWCKKEIQTFKKLRGRKNIFCVLIEGEPADSFPEEVLFDEKEVTLENGETKIEKINVEPLAADVRGKTKKEVLKKIKEEKLRLIAPMYNLDYDDLKQRHKLRKQKRILTISIIVAIACFLFAIYTSIMLIKINSQQDILKLHQALTLSSKAEEYIQKDNRYDAIKSSYEALTEFEGVKMPYTPEAEYALVESLGVYDIGYSYKAVSELKTKGVTDFIKSSKDGKYAASYDESEEITLFNSDTLKVIKTYAVKDMASNKRMFSFIGSDILAYINIDGNIDLVKAENGELITEIEKEEYSYCGLQGNETGEYFVYTDREKIYIYDVKENKKIGEITSNEKFINEIYFSEDNKYIFALTEKQNYDINVQDNLTLHVIDIKEAKELRSETFEAGYISGIVTKGNNAYILLNNQIVTDVNILLVSYNYIDGNVNWTNRFDKSWGKFITRSYVEDTNNIAVVSHDTVKIINADNGEVIDNYNSSSAIISIYSFTNEEIYLVFAEDGSVSIINMKYKKDYDYNARFELNLNNYTDMIQSTTGFLLIPKNENRIILYAKNKNEELKEEDNKIDFPKNESVSLKEQKELIEEYDFNNKNLISNIFYDTEKKLLFVNYTNNDIAIYNVENKALLKTLSNIGSVNHYFGKDKYNRIYIGEVSDTYILDENFNKVGYISGLRKLEEDKVIICNNDKSYTIKIYKLNELLEKAKEYLK